MSSSQLSRRRNRIALAAISVAVLVAAGIGIVLLTRDNSASRHSGQVTVQGATKIAAADHINLDAIVYEPGTNGKHPLVVLPASFAAAAITYQAVAQKFVAAGFVVVSYTQRGFYKSGGAIDFAGPLTQSDASTVITWALEHTSADPTRVGMMGISYGAGISLLTAAHDKRVRAVVAMSTWTDMAASFHLNNTTSTVSLGGLLSEAKDTGRLSGQITALSKHLVADPVAGGAEFASVSKVRSSATYLADLNRNKPAIMIANAWEDSIFDPLQLISFFGGLTGPKRLQLAPGDHGGPEASALTGAPNTTVSDALDWMAHYLQGVGNGINIRQPVQLQDSVTGAMHSYPAWPGRSNTNASMSSPGRPGAGLEVGGAHEAWTATVRTGTDTVATSGPSMFVSSSDYHQPTASVAGLSSADAFVWNGPALATPVEVSGTPSVAVSVSSSTPSTSMYLYLYDTGPDGTGRLMSVTPFTGTKLSATTPKPVTISLEPNSWTVAAGHHLTLVVDTVDPRWHSAGSSGSTLTLSSSATAPAAFRVPTP